MSIKDHESEWHQCKIQTEKLRLDLTRHRLTPITTHLQISMNSRSISLMILFQIMTVKTTSYWQSAKTMMIICFQINQFELGHNLSTLHKTLIFHLLTLRRE